MAILDFLSTAEFLVIFVYDHRTRKVAQGVFVVLHSGDKYEHLSKLWMPFKQKTGSEEVYEVKGIFKNIILTLDFHISG